MIFFYNLGCRHSDDIVYFQQKPFRMTSNFRWDQIRYPLWAQKPGRNALFFENPSATLLGYRLVRMNIRKTVFEFSPWIGESGVLSHHRIMKNSRDGTFKRNNTSIRRPAVTHIDIIIQIHAKRMFQHSSMVSWLHVHSIRCVASSFDPAGRKISKNQRGNCSPVTYYIHVHFRWIKTAKPRVGGSRQTLYYIPLIARSRAH